MASVYDLPDVVAAEDELAKPLAATEVIFVKFGTKALRQKLSMRRRCVRSERRMS